MIFFIFLLFPLVFELQDKKLIVSCFCPARCHVRKPMQTHAPSIVCFDVIERALIHIEIHWRLTLFETATDVLQNQGEMSHCSTPVDRLSGQSCNLPCLRAGSSKKNSLGLESRTEPKLLRAPCFDGSLFVGVLRIQK